MKCLINIDSLAKSLGENRVKLNEPLSLHTTLKIGGPADVLYEANNSGELIKAIRLARSFGVPVSIVGEGSNILISDLGIRGLVVKNVGGKIELREKGFLGFRKRRNISIDLERVNMEALTVEDDLPETDNDSDLPNVEVALGSGVNLQKAIDRLLEIGITGLQWYANIPGTIGGAVCSNIQSGEHTFSSLIKEVMMLDSHGGVIKVPANEIDFPKIKSRLHDHDEIMVEVILNLKRGDAKTARMMAEMWKKKRRSQPENSVGQVFKNIAEEERRVLGYPTSAPEYIVEHILNMTGYSIGGAMISPNHHNFIVNTGGATAKDFLAVRDEIVRRAKEAIGLTLEDKIVCLGEFED